MPRERNCASAAACTRGSTSPSARTTAASASAPENSAERRHRGDAAARLAAHGERFEDLEDVEPPHARGGRQAHQRVLAVVVKLIESRPARRGAKAAIRPA